MFVDSIEYKQNQLLESDANLKLFIPTASSKNNPAKIKEGSYQDVNTKTSWINRSLVLQIYPPFVKLVPKMPYRAKRLFVFKKNTIVLPKSNLGQLDDFVEYLYTFLKLVNEIKTQKLSKKVFLPAKKAAALSEIEAEFYRLLVLIESLKPAQIEALASSPHNPHLVSKIVTNIVGTITRIFIPIFRFYAFKNYHPSIEYYQLYKKSGKEALEKRIYSDLAFGLRKEVTFNSWLAVSLAISISTFVVMAPKIPERLESLFGKAAAAKTALVKSLSGLAGLKLEEGAITREEMEENSEFYIQKFEIDIENQRQIYIRTQKQRDYDKWKELVQQRNRFLGVDENYGIE